MKYARLRDEMLRKARESALLAVEVYNKPAIHFKSGGYVVLMTIAWTSLFHAIFYKRKIKPFYKSKGKFVTLPGSDGEYRIWELDKCARVYFAAEPNNPIEKNLGFFIPLRNHFEHRSYPSVDADIFGECQAMLLNFDEIIGKEFGDGFRIRESLSFSLQLFPSTESFSVPVRREAERRDADSERVTSFIRNYRSMIGNDVLTSGKYAFKAFLIQVSNHRTTDALPVQFINYNNLTPDEQAAVEAELGKVVSLTRVKTVEVPVVNKNLLRPTDIVPRVLAELGNPRKIDQFTNAISRAFTTNLHASCAREYKVRPESKSDHPEVTQSKYCVYDSAHKDYLYTEDWISYLVEKLTDPVEFERVLNLSNDNNRYKVYVATTQ